MLILTHDTLGQYDDTIGRDDDTLGRDDDTLGRDDDTIGRDDDTLGRDDDTLGRDDDTTIQYNVLIKTERHNVKIETRNANTVHRLLKDKASTKQRLNIAFFS